VSKDREKKKEKKATIQLPLEAFVKRKRNCANNPKASCKKKNTQFVLEKKKRKT
jgi:hypothetical protein